MAERDSLASLRQPGRLAMALGSLFRPSYRDDRSDGRLETLRRVAVLMWHDCAVPTDELNAFVEIGFSIVQFNLIATSINQSRNVARQGNRS